MSCGCRHNPPRGYHETYDAKRFGGQHVHVLGWHDGDGRGYDLSLSPYSGGIVFMRGAMFEGATRRPGDFIVTGKLKRGAVEMYDLGASGRSVFEQMWRRLLERMAAGGRRRNPVPENHGDEVDAATQAEIDEAFRTLPVRVYGGDKRRRR